MSENPTLTVQNSTESLRLTSGSGLQYPLDLGSDLESRFMTITVFEYSKNGIEDSEKNSPLLTIALPMPLELQDVNEHQYEEFGGLINRILAQNFNSLEDFTASAAAGDAIETAGNILASGASKFLDTAAIQREFFGGITLNPRTSVFFQSPRLKTYSFRYNMIAKNEKESQQITDIVNNLKFYSYPELAGKSNNLFKHPQLFRIRFLPESKHLVIPNDCVLTGISVSYNDQTQGVFHANGAPTEVSVQLTFTEIEFDTKQSLREKYL